MSTLQSRRSPLDVIRALRAAKLNGGDLESEVSCRLALAEALERRQLLTVTAASITPPVSATIGSSAVFTPSATTDHDPATTNWTIGFGDGTTYTGTIAGTTTVGHTYAVPGTYSVAGQATDGTGGYYYCSTTISVADAAISPAGGMNTTDIGTVEGESYGGVVAHFVDANPAATAADFAASISFGDGTTISGSIAADPGGGFDVIGSHTYTEQGSYGGYVHIVDDYSGSLYMYVDAAITPASITATTGTGTFAEGYSQTVTTIPFEDANPYKSASSLSAEIYWGDGTSDVGTVVSEGSGNFEVTGIHMYATAGTFTGSVEVTGTGGVSAGASYTATSANIDSLTVTNDYDDTQTETTPASSDTLMMTAPSYSTTASLSAGISPSGSAAATDAAVYKELDPTGATIASGTLGSGADIPLNWAPYADGATLTIDAGIQTTTGAVWMQTMNVTKHKVVIQYSAPGTQTGTLATNRLTVHNTGAATSQFQYLDATEDGLPAGTFTYVYTTSTNGAATGITASALAPDVNGLTAVNINASGVAPGDYNIVVISQQDPSVSIGIYITVVNP